MAECPAQYVKWLHTPELSGLQPGSTGSAMPPVGSDQLPWNVLVRNAVCNVAESFEKHANTAYAKVQLQAQVLQICEHVDGQGFVMKSKFRRAMFQKVEAELPARIGQEFDQVLQKLLQSLEDTLQEGLDSMGISPNAVGGDLLTPVKKILGKLRDDLREAVLKEEMQHLLKNIAATGLVVVACAAVMGSMGSMGLTISGATSPALAVAAPLAAAAAPLAAAGGAIYLGFQVSWNESSERDDFVDEFVNNIAPALGSSRLSTRVRDLLMKHISSLESLEISQGDVPSHSVDKPVEDGDAEVETPVQAAKKYMPFRNILWHDPRVNNEENKSYQDLLRKTYKDLVCSNDFAKAADVVKQNPLTAFIVISSGSKAKDLVPRISQLTNVTAIHIFCMDSSYHETQPWFLKNRMPEGRIAGIHTNVGKLVDGLAKAPEMPRVAFIKATALEAAVEEAKRIYLHSDVQSFVDQTSFSDAVAHLLQLRESRGKGAASESECARLADIFDPLHGKFKEVLSIYTDEASHVYDTLNSALRTKEPQLQWSILMQVASKVEGSGALGFLPLSCGFLFVRTSCRGITFKAHVQIRSEPRAC